MTRRLPLPVYRVQIQRHICSRWILAKQTIELVAVSEDHARLTALRQVHGQQGLPPWKPLLRISWPITTAKRTDTAPRVSVPDDRAQLEPRIAA